MEIVEWPSDVTPFRVAFYLQPHVGGSASPFNRQAKTYGLSAPIWVARLTFRGGYDGDDGAAAMGAYVDAFVAQLRGGERRVRFHDFRRPARRGSPIGGDLTNLAAAAGDTMIQIGGFPPFGYAYGRGDYIGGDGRPHIATADSFADEDGVATVHFEPPLWADVAEGAAKYELVDALWKLVGDDAGQNETEVGELTVVACDFVEDLSPYAA